MYNFDARSDLTGNQIIKTHTIGINTATNTIANALYANASDLIGGGIYDLTDGTFDAMLAQVFASASRLSGSFTVCTRHQCRWQQLIYTYYEVTNNDPLSKGHIRAYEIDNDPTNTTYGQVLYNGPTEFGGHFGMVGPCWSLVLLRLPNTTKKIEMVLVIVTSIL